MRLRDQHPQTVIIKELDVTQYEKISAFVEDIKVQLCSPLSIVEINFNIQRSR